METKRTMVLSFHVCRGGRFFNPGHVEFVGEKTFSDVCSMLSDRLFTKNRDEHDNGFIAKVEYIDGIIEEVGEDYRIEPGLSGSNLSAKISIKRITGKNPDKTKIRGLLKQAMKYYTSLSTFSADIGNITVRQMVLFIDTLILDGRKNAIAAGSDYNYRNTVLTSIAFLEAIKKELIGV